MFTGIVEAMGRVEAAGSGLRVHARSFGDDVVDGESICVSGVCLTVVSCERGDGTVMGFDLSPETLSRTCLGSLEPGDQVNLERSVTLLSRLGGHLVQGHVDGVGRIASVGPAGDGKELTITLPADLSRYVVEKGSIAVDGVSLTVTGVRMDAFGVALVPFTLEATTLGDRGPGDVVNLEVDIMAKYAERLLQETR